MTTFTVAGELWVDVWAPVPVEYADCSARHLVELYRTTGCGQERSRIVCALDSLSAGDLAAWLADEQEFQRRVGQYDVTALTRGHRDWLDHARDQIDLELSIVEARGASRTPTGRA